MSAGLTVSLLAVGLALCLWLAHIQTGLNRRRRNASANLRAEDERLARENVRPLGNCDVVYGGRRLP